MAASPCSSSATSVGAQSIGPLGELLDEARLAEHLDTWLTAAGIRPQDIS